MFAWGKKPPDFFSKADCFYPSQFVSLAVVMPFVVVDRLAPEQLLLLLFELPLAWFRPSCVCPSRW